MTVDKLRGYAESQAAAALDTLEAERAARGKHPPLNRQTRRSRMSMLRRKRGTARKAVRNA